MSSIYVHMGRIKEANYDLPGVEADARLVRNRIQRTKKEIPAGIASKYQIGQRLQDVCREIRSMEERINDLYEVVNICMEQYAGVEYANTRNAEAFH
ncbi:MAG: hypothetical protein NC548_24600 [Lachnospiraceae bacterium]|nr:hypothetical protein [Lachnospiraceae bacterium]